MDYQNTINLYVQENKIDNAAARVDYMTNPDVQQEKLIAVHGQQNPVFWKQLAEECRREFKSSDPDAVCIEAREYIIYLPNEFEEKNLPGLKCLIDSLTGTDCLLGFHDSHGAEKKSIRDENKHVHALIPERRLLLEPEKIIADRNYFINEKGKKERTKKEILDENGQLREGCQIIKKGEIYKSSCFSSKNELLVRADYFNDIKEEIAEWINREINPDKKRVVYDPETNPTIPQFKKVKGLSDEQLEDIEICNSYIKDYNELVRSGTIDHDTAMFYKSLIMLSPDRATEIDNILNKYEGKDVPDQTASIASNRPPESDKERLRGLYKAAAEERKKGNIQQARRISRQIDLLRKEMGLYTTKDYERAIENEKKEIAYYRKRLRLLRMKAIKEENFLRRSLAYLSNQVQRAIELMNRTDKQAQYQLTFIAASLYIHEGIDILADEFKGKSYTEIMTIHEERQQEVAKALEELRKGWEEEWKKTEELIRQADAALGQISEETGETTKKKDVYEQIEEAKSDYLQARKNLKEKKKELKQQLKIEAQQQKKEAKVVGLDSVIGGAARRSAATNKNILQPKNKDIRK